MTVTRKTKESDLPLRNVLLTLGALGTLTMWGGAVVDGSLWLLLKAVFSKEYILPGTQTRLQKSLTGIYWPIDFLLNILIAFFWEAVDGSHPTASAVGLYFLGQYLPILVMLYSDHFRAGNAGQRRNLTPWLLAFQCCGIGCVGPFWALCYFGNSPLAKPVNRTSLRSASRVHVPSLIVLPVALVLGYVFPSVLMGLRSPSIVSPDFQQRAIAVWNLFPLWTISLQQLLEVGLMMIAAGGTGQDTRTGFSCHTGPSSPTSGTRIQTRDGGGSHLLALRVVNSFAVLTGFSCHAVFVAMSVSTRLFPGLWAPGIADKLSPGALFVPPVFRSFSGTVGDGVQGFFLWDQTFGYTVIYLVTIIQLRIVVKTCGAKFKTLPALIAVVIGTAIIGPGSTCLIMSWVRDEILYRESDLIGEGENSAADGCLQSQERKSSIAESGYATPGGQVRR